MAEIVTKGVLTLDELKTVIGQEKKALVIYDVSTGAPNGLDVQVLINMDASIAAMDASVAQVWTMAQDIADATVAEVEALIEGYVADASTSSAEAIAAAASFPTTHPETAFYSRWLADTGTYMDRDTLLSAYAQYLDQLPTTQRLYIPELGAKLRTSGLNRYGVKAYDMSANAKDAVQLTDATQPYMTGGAAPNARLGMRFVQGQTQTGLMDFDDVVFAAGDSWTVTTRVKVNNKGGARIYLGASSISIEATGVRMNTGVVSALTGTLNFECGRTYTIEFQYSNGAGLILVNGIPIATTAISGAITFGQISYTTGFPFDGSLYAFHLTNTSKSAYQSQLDHTFLSTIFPDMESVVIGNQVWSTDNFCGTVAGDGTVVAEIQSATTAASTELIASTDLNTWTKDASVISAGNLTFTTNAAGSVSKTTYASLNKPNTTVLVGTSDVAWSLYDGTTKIVDVLVGAFNVTAYWRYTTSLRILLSGVGTITFSSMSNKESGAADSTLVYDYVYAATTGTAAVKDLAATKAAAWWCHYDNLADNGAVYGKLYNWYAVHLFDLYPPVKGWRVPSKLDFDQLVSVNGGSTVAGGRLKAKFGGFNNANASNESGFSAIAGGRVLPTGLFNAISIYSHIWSTDAYRLFTQDGSTASIVDAFDKTAMCSLRLLRNEPSLPKTFEKNTGFITTSPTGGVNLDIIIPFGCIVNGIRVSSRTAISSLSAVLYTGAGSAKETLLSGGAVVADTPIVFSTGQVAQSIQQTDAFVRVNGIKSETTGIWMVAIMLENAYTSTIV